MMMLTGERVDTAHDDVHSVAGYRIQTAADDGLQVNAGVEDEGRHLELADDFERHRRDASVDG